MLICCDADGFCRGRLIHSSESRACLQNTEFVLQKLISPRDSICVAASPPHISWRQLLYYSFHVDLSTSATRLDNRASFLTAISHSSVRDCIDMATLAAATEKSVRTWCTLLGTPRVKGRDDGEIRGWIGSWTDRRSFGVLHPRDKLCRYCNEEETTEPDSETSRFAWLFVYTSLTTCRTRCRYLFPFDTEYQ